MADDKVDNVILVIGATGNVGSEVVRRLASSGTRVRALVRSPQKGAELESVGAELAVGDVADPTTLAGPLEGVTRVFLVMSSGPAHEQLERSAVDALVQAGRPHVVKLSVIAANPDSPSRFFAGHGRIEKLIREANLPFTFLRPNDFMQNAFLWASSIAAEGRAYVTPGSISSVDVGDIAEVAVAALTGEGHEGAAYTLTGPEALSRAEQAAKIADALGRKVEIVEISSDQQKAGMLQAGVPEWITSGLEELQVHFFGPNLGSEITDDTRRITGREPRRFDDFARDFAQAVGGGSGSPG